MSMSMDAELAGEVLESTVVSVLADMLFLDCRRVPLGHEAFDMCVAVDILKPVSLRLELRMCRNFVEAIQDTLLAPLVEDMQEKKGAPEDLVLELVNVLAGNFLFSYFGTQPRAKLELPRYLAVAAPAASDCDGPVIAQAFFDAEDKPLQAAIRSIRYMY